MRGRGRGQLGALSTLLPHQTRRPRSAAGSRAGADPDTSAGTDAPDSTSSASGHAAGSVTAADTISASIDTVPGLGIVTGRRAGRTASADAVGRSSALRYAAWGWPVTPTTTLAATTDLEQVFATWSRLPEAPILAACGVAFDVIETDVSAGRTALARLDRLGVELGPVTIDAAAGSGSGLGLGLGAGAWVWSGVRGGGSAAGLVAGAGASAGASPGAGPGRSGRIGFLVRADSAAPLSALIDPATGPVLLGRGAHIELPRTLDQPEPFRPGAATGRYWLRPPGTPRPALPTAHVVLGALALVPHRSPAVSVSPPTR